MNWIQKMFFASSVLLYADLSFAANSHAATTSLTTTTTGCSGIENATNMGLVLSDYESYGGYCTIGCDPVTGANCHPSLSPDAPQSVYTPSPTYVYMQYSVCSSISYDASGNPTCGGYMGSIGLTFDSSLTPVKINQPVTGGTATLGTPINGYYPLYFTPTGTDCPLGTTIPSPEAYASIPYRGVNLLGCEYQTFTPPQACDAVYFSEQGANTIRLPVCWEYLQGDTPLGTAIDFSTGDALIYSQLVNNLTAAKMYVVIDMHNYMRYLQSAPGTLIDSANYIIGNTDPSTINGPTAEQYGIAWGSIAAEFATNPYVLFALMNEPNTMPTELIISNYNTAIPYIRNAENVSGGITHLLLLQGNAYSCMGDWEKDYYGTSNAVAFATGNIVDPKNYYCIDIHQYFNGSGSVLSCGNGSTECIDPSTMLDNENFNGFLSWLQTNSQRAFVTELGGIASSNCVECISNYLTAVQTYPGALLNPGTGIGGFVGWTGWGSTSSDPGYILNLAPTYSGDVPTPSYQFENGFQPFLLPLP